MKISQLPEIEQPDLANRLMVVEGTETKLITLEQLKEIVGSGSEEPSTGHIYGVHWSNFTSNTKGVRTDDAAAFGDPSPAISGGSGSSPFDAIAPWNGMNKETRGSNNVMVSIPKFWYKWTIVDGTNIMLQIADYPADGFHVSPAHMNRGDGKDERDVIYIGRYHSTVGSPSGDLRSLTGKDPTANQTHANARSGSKYDTFSMMDWATWTTFQMLYLVEYAEWNSQKAIGYGVGKGSVIANGSTDSMGYHTGTMDSSIDAKESRVQYRWVENPWGNVRDWVDGIRYAYDGMYTALNPANYADITGGNLVGKPSDGHPSALAISETGGFQTIYPTTANGSTSTGTCDYWGFGGSYPCLNVGGYYSDNANYGLFFVGSNPPSSTSSNIGSRLQELP